MLGANAGKVPHGVFTNQTGRLTNDFFVNLLDMGTQWSAVDDNLYEGRDRNSNALKWTATRIDLIFGSHSQLRAFAEVYGSADAKEKIRERLRRRLDQGDERRSLRLGGVTSPTLPARKNIRQAGSAQKPPDPDPRGIAVERAGTDRFRPLGISFPRGTVSSDAYEAGLARDLRLMPRPRAFPTAPGIC